MPATLDQKLARYEQLIAATPDVDRKGKTSPYTSMNGNMFSFIGKDETLAFRLSAADRTRFLDRFPDAVVEQHGSLMKHYVAVPDQMLDNAERLGELWGKVVANARELKPRETKRRKKT